MTASSELGVEVGPKIRRRTRLYHNLAGRDMDFRFGDQMYRRSRVFLDFLCMDGDDVVNATMCPTTQCTTCWCLKAELSDPDVVVTVEIQALPTKRMDESFALKCFSLVPKG